MLGADAGQNHFADTVFLFLDDGHEETSAEESDEEEIHHENGDGDDGFTESIRGVARGGEFIVSNLKSAGEGGDF